MMRSLLLIGPFGSEVAIAKKLLGLSLSKRVFMAAMVVLFAVGVLLPAPVFSQRKTEEAAEETDEDFDEESDDGLGGEALSLTTKDGLRMTCRYYPGLEDKETIPVVLLHGWKGQGSDFDALADYLQSDDGGAHAVIVPDLRGHGGSTELRPESSGSASKGSAAKSKTLNSNRTGKPEFQAMLKYDLEAIKSFLVKEHNAGKLNVDGLTVVGAEMGAVLSMYWTARDWNWEPLAGIKQGQDVKALVLLSTPASFKGITPNAALKQTDLRDKVSMLMLFGEKEIKQKQAGERLFNTVKRHRNQVFKSKEEKREKQDLFLFGLDTKLQGAELLESDLPTARYIGQFIDGRVRAHMEEKFPWKKRRQAN